MSMLRRGFWFAVAGVVGFAVDAGILQSLVWLGSDPLVARLGSFAAAIVATWLVNRRFAFGDRAKGSMVWEFLRYLAASALAAIINLGVYTLLILWGDPFRSQPVLALVIATAVSMTVNFVSYLKLVFRPKAP